MSANPFDEILTRLDVIEGKLEMKAEPISVKVENDNCGFQEAMEITGRSKSWVYLHTMANCEDPLPYRKFNRQLIFSRKELKAWVEAKTISPLGSAEIMTDRLSESAKKRM